MKVGDTVRLKTGDAYKGIVIKEIPKWRENHETAIIEAIYDGVIGGVKVDRDLKGMEYWNEEDLEVVT